MAAASPQSFDLVLGGIGARIEGELVSSNLFQVLRIEPRQGRMLTASDATERPGTVPCVIAEGLWRRAFGTDPAFLGRTFLSNQVEFTVVGVVSEAFARWRQPACPLVDPMARLPL